MSIQDTVIEILERSNDGDRLTPQDLALTESAVNFGLNEAGEVRLAQLHADVTSGEYFNQAKWFRGVEHMTQDHHGYVYWKGKQVEHYSFTDKERELESLHRLAESCQRLESLGIPVNGRTAICNTLKDAYVGSPWTLAARFYYSFFQREAAVIGIFYRATSSDGVPPEFPCFSVEKLSDGSIQVKNHIGAYEAFHATQDSGAVCMPVGPSFGDLESWLTTMGMSAEALDKEIKS